MYNTRDFRFPPDYDIEFVAQDSQPMQKHGTGGRDEGIKT